MYSRVYASGKCNSYREMLTGGGRTVADFLPENPPLDDAIALYRSLTNAKYKDEDGIERGAVWIQCAPLEGD